jgi:PhnB protein
MRSPKSVGGTAVMVHAYVDDVDVVFDAAVEAGAKSLQAVKDPFGHRRNIATHVEDVPHEEMEKRAAEAMSGS